MSKETEALWFLSARIECGADATKNRGELRFPKSMSIRDC